MLTKCNDSIRPCNVGQYILLHYSLHTGMYTVIVFDTEEIQCCVMISVFFLFLTVIIIIRNIIKGFLIIAGILFLVTVRYR